MMKLNSVLPEFGTDTDIAVTTTQNGNKDDFFLLSETKFA